MKRFIKFAYTAVVGVALMATAACTNDYSYDSIAAESGQEVYFPSTNAANVSLVMGEGMQTFEIPVTRVKTESAATVNITSKVAQHSSLFSIPSSVSFAAGQSETKIPVSYNAAELGYENPDTLSFTISDETAVTPYGAKEYTCTVLIPAPLKLLGTGSFTDNFWFEESNDVKIYQNTLNPNEFRIMDPFNMCAKYSACTGNQSEYVTVTLLKPGQTAFGVDITMPDLVYFTPINTGYYHSTYSQEIWCYHPSAFTSLRTQSAWAYNKVVEYQENGLPGRIQLAPYYYMDGVGGWNNTAANDVIIIDFPGYTPKDFSLEVEYLGVLTDVKEINNAYVNIVLGEDVTNAQAVIVPADADIEAVADAILAGDLETYEVTEAGNHSIPIPDGMTGKLQVVVVVIDDAKVKMVSAVGFEYYGGGKNPWVSLGNGLYTDAFVGALFGLEDVTYEVEIQENTETPGLYRLMYPYDGKFPYNKEGDWDTSADYNIEINAEDPEGVYIDLQPTGVDWGYGMMSFMSWGARFLASYSLEDVKKAGHLGTLKSGIITLPVYERTLQDGTKSNYQGLIADGDGSYYGGSGNFKVVLPSAVTPAARRAAQSQARAASFASRLKGNFKIDRNTRLAKIKTVITCRLLKD